MTSSQKAGVAPEAVRLSVGLEDLDDLMWDVDRALGVAVAPAAVS